MNSTEIKDSCTSPPAAASDPDAAKLLASMRGHHDLDGTWLNGGTAAVLTVEVIDNGERLPGSGNACGDSLLLGATVNVKTRDGVVDGNSSVVRFDDPRIATIEVPLPALPEAYAHPDPSLPPLVGMNESVQPNVDLASSTVPTIVLTFAADMTMADLIVDQRRTVGRWSSEPHLVPGRRATYVVPAELVADCAPAADYTAAHGQYTSFDSGAAATAATVGTWIRCRSFGGPAHDGIQVSPDGSWRMLAWQDGMFVTRGGIQREGALEPPIDTSSFNGAGFYQVNLRGPAVWRASHVWENRLLLSDDTAPPTLGESVYVRTERGVQNAPNPYGPGERAGAEGCAVAEAGTLDPDLGAAMESTLAGTWALCSGELLEGYGGLTFDGNGAVTVLDTGGLPTGGFSYRAMHPETMPALSPRETVLVLPDQRVWTIFFSEHPLKLWLSESGPHTTDRVALFSGLP